MTNKDSAVKRLVKQSNQTVLLLGSLPYKALKILEILGAGGTAQQAAKQIHCTKQNVSYWVKKLQKQGYLQLQIKDVVKLYQLTPHGKRIFTTSEESKVLEDYAVKFQIVEGEKVGLDWEKLGQPNNWEKLGIKVGSVRVVKTSQSVIVHPGRMVGFDFNELLVEVGRVIECTRDILVNKFGMVLSDAPVPLHEPIVRFYSEEAKEDVKNGTVIVEGVGSIDQSPPERIPHEEYKGIDRAKARLLLPDSVKVLMDKVDALQLQVNSLTDSTTRIADVLGKLLGSSEDTTSIQKPLGKMDYST